MSTKPNQDPIFTVVIADDHAMLRAGMRHMLQSNLGINIVGEAEDGFAALTCVRELKPDLLLLDIAMPRAQGLEVINEVKRWAPETKIVVCTGLTSKSLFADLIAIGADGIFSKRGDPQFLLEALPKIMNGEAVISADIKKTLEEAGALNDLTPREVQVFHLVVAGGTNSSIAERLGVSAKTIDNHRTNIMRKLGVHSKAEMMALAAREGLFEANKEL